MQTTTFKHDIGYLKKTFFAPKIRIPELQVKATAAKEAVSEKQPTSEDYTVQTFCQISTNRDFMCPICQELCIDPVAPYSCQDKPHIICSKCYQYSVKANVTSCSICRAEQKSDNNPHPVCTQLKKKELMKSRPYAHSATT